MPCFNGLSKIQIICHLISTIKYFTLVIINKLYNFYSYYILFIFMTRLVIINFAVHGRMGAGI